MLVSYLMNVEGRPDVMAAVVVTHTVKTMNLINAAREIYNKSFLSIFMVQI